MTREPLVNSVPPSVGHSLRLKMTPPQNCRDWQRWMPPNGGGVVSKGGFHHSPAATPSLPWGLSK